MNTADRGIALLDHALRRRFEFDSVLPEPDLLGVVVEGEHTIDLAELLVAMNRRIEFLLDADHTIGHAYLLRAASLTDVAHIFRCQILPLLAEYFYGDWARVQLVLGGDGAEAMVRSETLAPTQLFGPQTDDYEPRLRYAVAEHFTAGTFQRIYGGD